MLNKKYRGEEGLLKPFDYDNYGSDNVVIEGCNLQLWIQNTWE